MIEITFPDGIKKKYPKDTTVLEILKELPQKIRQEALAAKVNDKLVDLSSKIDRNSTIKIITFNDKEGIEVFRHSTAHVLAQAVTELYPYAKLTVGPVVDEGFYYDIEHEPFTPEDLIKIESKMKEIVDRKTPIERTELTKKEAKEMFKDNKYKLEMIEEMDDTGSISGASGMGGAGGSGEVISTYNQGKFIDLCRGPHVPHTGIIKAFKLMKIAGAYWRGDQKNKQLQRIYGISFPDRKMLANYLHILEEAKKRDHRILGKRLELFSFHDEGKGFPFFLNNGIIIWNELLNFWREEHKKAGYIEIKTPVILNKSLWETSGHWSYYKDNMYTLKIDDEENAIKPMNCPGGMLVYKEKLHSYRELPLRVGEIGHVHRHELSGVLSGLFRVRAFHQDDAHIFMTKEQITGEVLDVLKLAEKFYKTFGLDYHLELSTKPPKSVGTDEQWEQATKGLKDALDSTGKTYKINEGDGAFYGPKIDLHIKDAIGRTWQCGTIQLDMALPERFDLTYEDKDGTKHRPVMIHRVIYGSLERFFGVLIEHFAGKFPLWLSPTQVRILTVSDNFNEYGEKIRNLLEAENIRVDVDSRTESVPKKVRDAQMDLIPLVLTVGEKETSSNTVAIRTLDGQVKFGVSTDEFVRKVKEIIKSKAIEIKL
ncbi:threonine--tRNA ligase [Candidatus Woesearchaeota archaeon]|nr:threonine--tRNA ligase [Candidatus Woesearchaeota archaeon]